MIRSWSCLFEKQNPPPNVSQSMYLLNAAIAIDPEISKIRREIHAKADLAYREQTTAKLVAEQLKALGIQVKQGGGGTGILGILKRPKPGRVVALRADLDARPLDELAGAEFKSKAQSVSHACGHAAHVAL